VHIFVRPLAVKAPRCQCWAWSTVRRDTVMSIYTEGGGGEVIMSLARGLLSSFIIIVPIEKWAPIENAGTTSRIHQTILRESLG
jgi:hypothetical protein